MQHASVEGAVTGEPALSGSFNWQDDSTLTFTPDTSLLPGTSLTINIGTTAQSAKGMALLRPISLSYTTSAYLNLVQSLPEADASDVNPTSAVVAAFNQPVVPLGADPASLPVGFHPDALCRRAWRMDQHQHLYFLPRTCPGRWNILPGEHQPGPDQHQRCTVEIRTQLVVQHRPAAPGFCPTS